jgi:biopolymer transport protein ExbD
MSRLRPRHHHPPPELNITAFMNLMVILVPFLLVTAVFSRISIMELTLPAPAGSPPPPDHRLTLEITVRRDRIEVADRGGAPVVIPGRNGEYDLASLSNVIKAVKTQYPDETRATILLEPDIRYETMIHVMDAVRVGTIVRAATPVRVELFPEISIGDAPAASEGT